MGSYATEHEHSLCHAAAIGASAVTGTGRCGPGILREALTVYLAELRPRRASARGVGDGESWISETGCTRNRARRNGWSRNSRRRKPAPSAAGFHRGAKERFRRLGQEEYPRLKDSLGKLNRYRWSLLQSVPLRDDPPAW